MGSGNRHVGLDGIRAILGSPLYMWADSHAIRGGYPPGGFPLQSSPVAPEQGRSRAFLWNLMSVKPYEGL